MYGKHFSSMYEGSMVGAGPTVFALWGYVIAKTDPDEHTIDLNPMLLSCIIGCAVSEIRQAITYLTQPDPHSHCQEYDGARLVHRGGHTYFVVTHEQYRAMRNNDERRAYNREMQRKHRERVSASKERVIDKSITSLTSASVSSSVSSSKKGDSKGGDYTDDFERFWRVYPRKQSKADAFKAWKQMKHNPPLRDLIDILNKHKMSTDWVKDNGTYIPYAATWIRGQRWEDELSQASLSQKEKRPTLKEVSRRG